MKTEARTNEAFVVNRFLVQHGTIRERKKSRNDFIDSSLLNEAESPLAWLARRRGRNGAPLISSVQFQAGERLRCDFTCAGLTPRMSANWITPVSQERRSTGETASSFAEAVLTAKDRLRKALDIVGPEFSGILLDVCCFLKGLELVERERQWPQRTAKVVLGLALNRLARFYGIADRTRGPKSSPTRAWQAEGARPTIDGS